MPALFTQIATLVADLAIVSFIIYYFLRLWTREKDLEKKEHKIDNDYHQIVDNALTKERKIIEDATTQADQIIAQANHINQGVKDEINQALQVMVVDIQKQAMETAQNFTQNYQLSLKNLAQESLGEFKNIAGNLQSDLQKQIKEFHESLLPALEKQLEEYKKTRMAQTDKTIAQIITKASQEIVNKSISLEDHKNLVIESLEKAKKEGVFD